MERSGDNGEGYESHLQGFVGGDTRGNIVRQTGFTFQCYSDGGEWGCSWWLEFEVGEEGDGCGGCVKTGLV